MKDDRIWKLLARKLTGEASQDDLIELENLIKENPNLHPAIDALTRFWNAPANDSKGK